MSTCTQHVLVLAAGVLTTFAVTIAAAQEADSEAALPLAAHGTPFRFEIIESHDGKYLGDTPSHMGRDGGLTVKPRVALGDPVYKSEGEARMLIGRITRVAWSRVSGSLEVEFHPEPFRRIAVGDEVWVDLNPAPRQPGDDAAAR